MEADIYIYIYIVVGVGECKPLDGLPVSNAFRAADRLVEGFVDRLPNAREGLCASVLMSTLS